MHKKDGVRIALIGNPNSGKTTLFNTLTGSKQHVGNWPGKTVERKDGSIVHNGKKIEIIDLPGVYSIDSFSEEERISRDFILDGQPDILINIIDATNLQRNLYLTLEVLELCKINGKSKLIVALNMENIAKKKGLEIDTHVLSELLGVKVIIANARDKEECILLIEKSLEQRNKEIARDEIQRINYGEFIEKRIGELSAIIRENGDIDEEHARWIAIRFISKDDNVNALLPDTSDKVKISDYANKMREQLQKLEGKDIVTMIAERRHNLAAGMTKESMKRLLIEESVSYSDRVDKIVMHKYFGIPIFLVVVYLIFFLTFTLARPFNSMIEYALLMLSTKMSGILTALSAPRWLDSLILDGMIGGVGSILVFVPSIFIMFLIVSILEDSGYLARAAFIADNLMHKIGLHGKSFIPLILGFGCSVPAMMAARTLESRKDRILTMLITPFMSCSARLPVYVMLVTAFFAHYQSLIIFSLYLLGIVLAIISGILFKWLFFKGEESHLLMEIPPYRMPTVTSLLLHAWERAKMFIYKAGTLIFSASVVIWFLSNLPLGVEYASEDSFIGIIGKSISPMLSPLGFGFWEAAVALLFGVVAKEVVVSTFATLYGVGESGLTNVVGGLFTPLSAYAFMIMSLIYIPCISTIATIKQETNSWKWATILVIYTTVLGWVVAFAVYNIGLLMGFS